MGGGQKLEFVCYGAQFVPQYDEVVISILAELIILMKNTNTRSLAVSK